MLQVHLQAFRVQWMSDLKLSAGSGGTSDKARTPEVPKEERVSCKMRSWGGRIVLHIINWQLLLSNPMSLCQATELFMRAVDLEQNGSFYEGMKVCLLYWWSFFFFVAIMNWIAQWMNLHDTILAVLARNLTIQKDVIIPAKHVLLCTTNLSLHLHVKIK